MKDETFSAENYPPQMQSALPPGYLLVEPETIARIYNADAFDLTLTKRRTPRFYQQEMNKPYFFQSTTSLASHKPKSAGLVSILFTSAARLSAAVALDLFLLCFSGICFLFHLRQRNPKSPGK